METSADNIIKHLVLGGGGPGGLITYGAASHLAKANFWSLSNIKSIYGCSIGAFMGMLFSLGYEWEWLDDYFIKRPWNKLIESSTIHIIEMFTQKALINENFFIESVSPLLRGKDLKENITMAELYAFNNIELHIYVCNINSVKIEKIDISYKTHPNLPVVTAMQMTMAVPLIFKPVFEGAECYIDGGLLNNFPLNDCLEQQKCAPTEVLAFKNIFNFSNPVINEKSSLLDFILIIMRKMQLTLDTEDGQPEIKNMVKCVMDNSIGCYTTWLEFLSNETARHHAIEVGKIQAEDFIKNFSAPV